jgi:HAE1 family hydrophobic/amphiphilic exporter-1
MTRLFDKITQLSLKARWLTVALTVAALALGVIALIQLNLELLPPVDFPVIVAVSFWQGASAEETLDQLTVPMENAVKEIEGIKNLESNTGGGYAALVLSTEFGLDQESLRQEIADALASAPRPDDAEPPELLSFGLDDIPVVVASVSSSQLSLPELKRLVESSIVSELEDLPGVERIAVSGGQELPDDLPESPETPGVPLPSEWIEGAAAMGQTIATTADITPQMMQFIIGFQPEALSVLTLEMWQAFPPEVLAVVSEESLIQVPAELVDAVRDLLAGTTGGSTEPVVIPQEPPLLPESWRQPPPDGSQPQVQFETAADLMNNPFNMPAAQLLNLLVEMGTVPNAPELVADLTAEIILWLDAQDSNFLPGLSPALLRLFSPRVLSNLPAAYVETLDPALRAELEALAGGTVTAFVPSDVINRTNGNPSLLLIFFKGGSENIVVVSHAIFDRLDEMERANSDLTFEVAFEQSSFIEESISGVAREGVLGAAFAVLVILVFLSGFVNGRYRLSWRSTLVTAVSIPLSVFIGFAAMRWLPALHPPFKALESAWSDLPVLSSIGTLLVRLFPGSMTLNIMTLSGMTVAVGRVVDDSIVVLENIYRRIQRGDERREAVIGGTRDVAIAIFASTVTTVIVFLPLGLIGGLVGEFFLPFGLTVTYALGASFVVAITVVPVLAYLFIHKETMPAPKETWMQRTYTPVLKWALGHRFWTVVIAAVLFLGSLWLLALRPQAFIPAMGEPTIDVAVDLPNGTRMTETDATVQELEAFLMTQEGIEVYETEIGSNSGISMRAFFDSGIDQSAASVRVAPASREDLERLLPLVRAEAERIFGKDYVTVSMADMTSGGFGASFSLVLTGEPDDLAAVDEQVIATLEDIDGLANVTSNLTTGETVIRINGQRAVNYSAELETRDTLGVTAEAKEAISALGLPESIIISEGFETSTQTESFADMGRALIISILAVYIVLALTFRSFIHPFTILFSLPLAVVGAALGLAITNRVLGISAMIGLMMLVGIVVTNAIVLLERVQQNRRQRGMNAYDALVEGGRTRMRPIWMTALAAVLALIPLAMGFTEGAIIASELATVVIGGLLTSTLLTLLIIPVAYSLFEELGRRLRRRK